MTDNITTPQKKSDIFCQNISVALLFVVSRQQDFEQCFRTIDHLINAYLVIGLQMVCEIAQILWTMQLLFEILILVAFETAMNTPPNTHTRFGGMKRPLHGHSSYRP